MVEMSQQDQAAMQEKLKDMSPEELKKLQQEQCIFCHIISGKVASKKVYEDKVCIAILDINPANPGHVLIIPKEHHPIMPLIPDEEIQHLGMVSKAISQVLLKALKVEGTTVFIANGAVAGQRAQHFMIHVIPRKEGDNIGLTIPKGTLPDDVLGQLQTKIKTKVNEMFDIKEEVVEKEESVEEEKDKEETEETKEEKPKKSKNKKEKAKKKKAEKKPKEEPGEESEDVSLDDIAELLK